jgi:hypothetical protein
MLTGNPKSIKDMEIPWETNIYPFSFNKINIKGENINDRNL